MPGRNNGVERKCSLAIQKAISRKINDLIPGHVGLTDDSLDLPHFSVHVPSSTEMIQNTGTQACDVEIKVKSDKDTSSDDGSPSDHDNREAAVYDAVLTDPMATFIGEMNTAQVDDFTAFVLRETGRASGIEGRAFVSTLKLLVICCGAKIS